MAIEVNGSFMKLMGVATDGEAPDVETWVDCSVGVVKYAQSRTLDRGKNKGLVLTLLAIDDDFIGFREDIKDVLQTIKAVRTPPAKLGSNIKHDTTI